MTGNASDYNLHYIAEHNAHMEDFGHSNEWSTSDFDFDLSLPSAETNYTYQDPQKITSLPIGPPQDQSDASKRTRSGRVVRRTQSPAASSGVSSGRISKSPRPKKSKAKGNKTKNFHLPGPLSELTKNSEIPVRDIHAWVNRPLQQRQDESRAKNGYISRPMNSFMLYRSAYAERTKEWCKENNHQIVSSAAGESWPMESEELRNQFNMWAKVERDNHALAFPHYKFSPSKAGTRRKKDEVDDAEDPDKGDSDAEYFPNRRMAKQVVRSQHPASFRSDSPATSEAYSYVSDAEYGYDYLWSTQHGVRPPPMPHGYPGEYDQQYGFPAPYPGSFHHMDHPRSVMAGQPPFGHHQDFRQAQYLSRPEYSSHPYDMGSSGIGHTSQPFHDFSWQGSQTGGHASEAAQMTLLSPTSLQFIEPANIGMPGQEFHEFSVDPRLTTTGDLGAAYGRDLDQNRGVQ